jgi:23S rRNA (cytidine1920-2'-O)/16S rRNA (cytidine1409-2'-O)-methyltransferase
MSSKTRLDRLLVERGLADTRSLAQRLVMAGQVRVNGQVEIKASRQFTAEDEISVDHGPRYVSRGGLKLEAALHAYPVKVEGMVCADVGASTGGFTDCLLQHGAARVYAIDVGHGQLDWGLRQNPHVIVKEHTNARHLESLPEPIDLVTVDAAFISLKLLLPRIQGWLDKAGQVVCLIKPQFEAGPAQVGKGGVVKDSAVHRQVVEEVMTEAERLALRPAGLLESPIQGPKGNHEFLLWCVTSGEAASVVDLLSGVFTDSA